MVEKDEYIELVKHIHLINDVIKRLSKEEITMRETLLDLERTIELKELSIFEEVALAKDGAGKPKFSNDGLRKAEVAELLEHNEIYQKLQEDKKKLSRTVKEIVINREYEERLFQMRMVLLGGR